MTGDDVEYLVVHTAAFERHNCDRDMIDRWHRQKGWAGIGYHYVILDDRHDELDDGTVQEGRGLSRMGAHVLGVNGRSIGICCAGHGDRQPHTDAQRNSLLRLLSDLMDDHPHVTIQNIIGHREVNDLVREGHVEARFGTSKTCPGTLVDMDEIRDQVRELRTPPALENRRDDRDGPAAREIKRALNALSALPPTVFPNAHDELRAFLFHPEVRAMLE